MKGLCISPESARKLVQAFQKGEIDVASLVNPDITNSEARRAVFEQYMDTRTAKYVNAELEKAIISDQKDALTRWFKKVTPKQIQDKGKQGIVLDGIISKIEAIDTVLGAETSGQFLEDLVEQSLGVDISSEEGAKIYELHKKMKEAEAFDEFGLPVKEWWKARKELENYLDSITPVSAWKVFFSTAGRGALLLSIKSPVTNIVGNIVMGLEQMIERRVENTTLAPNHAKLMSKYMANAMSIYQSTGYDVTRMYSMESSRKTLGEEITHAQGKGVVRKLGRFYEDVVFKNLMGAPDIAFSAYAFSESLAMSATLIAKQENLKGKALIARSEEIFLDGTKIEPDTEQGKKARFKAIADAEYATFQNNSYYSKAALGVRGLMNDVSGNIQLGDNFIPFAKTPANVVGAGIDAMGISAGRAIWKLRRAFIDMRNGDGTKMREVARLFTRSGMGLVFAFLLVGLLDPDDYIGEYPVNATERELLRTRNATPNSLRMGDKWVSLDYFGFVGAPIVGLMYAKKYGGAFWEDLIRFGQGGFVQLTKVPGFEQIRNFAEAIADIKKEGGLDIKKIGKSTASGAVDFLAARTIPSIVSDIARVFDDFERKRDYEKPLQALQTRIPGWRENMQMRTNAFNEPIETEQDYSIILFGSRVKTDTSNKITEEYVRLKNTGNMPTLVNIETSSDRVKALKTQISEVKYKQAIANYGVELKRELLKELESSAYKKKTDEEKKDALNKVRNKVLDDMLKKYNYKKPKKEKD
jgi:hypothetical protein